MAGNEENTALSAEFVTDPFTMLSSTAKDLLGTQHAGSCTLSNLCCIDRNPNSIRAALAFVKIKSLRNAVRFLGCGTAIAVLFLKRISIGLTSDIPLTRPYSARANLSFDKFRTGSGRKKGEGREVKKRLTACAGDLWSAASAGLGDPR